jgi:hypothetical protein
MKMHKTLKGMVIVLGLAAAPLALASTANADGVGIGVHVGGIGIGLGVGDHYGNVAYGYQDGYWDHSHHWNQWRDQDEMNRYRKVEHNQYHDWKHDRDQDQGWHDEAK